MEKTIKIDGKDVRLKSSAALPLKYKAQFGRDFFADIDKKGKIESDVLYNVLWVLAKTADDSIPALIEWVDSFEEFPVFGLFNDVSDLVAISMGRSVKNAKAAVGE